MNLGEDGRGFQEGRGRRHTRASKVSLKCKEKVIVSKSNLLSWQLTLLSYKIREDEGSIKPTRYSRAFFKPK